MDEVGGGGAGGEVGAWEEAGEAEECEAPGEVERDGEGDGVFEVGGRSLEGKG